MTELKIRAIQAGFAAVCLISAAVMLLLISAAALGIPVGLMICFFGFAVKLFHADFIVTSLSAEMMIFGGLACAFGTAFLGLAGVKLGFVLSRCFVRVRRKCDLLRGWKPL